MHDILLVLDRKNKYLYLKYVILSTKEYIFRYKLPIFVN